MCRIGRTTRHVDQHATGGCDEVGSGIADERAGSCGCVREGHGDPTLGIGGLQGGSSGDGEVIADALT